MTSSTPHELLDSARTLIERGWCQHAMARDRDNLGVEPSSAEACAWSASGAVLAAWSKTCPWPDSLDLDDVFHPFEHANLALAGSVPAATDEWNDARGRTREQVLRAFDRAVVLLDWPPLPALRPRFVRIRRRLVTHGAFDRSEAYDYDGPFELLSTTTDGEYTLRDRSGNVTVFQAGGLYADLEAACDACHRWSDHVTRTKQDWSRWVCYGGAAPCAPLGT